SSAQDLAPQRERLPELDPVHGPRLCAPARVHHHAQDAVDAEPGCQRRASGPPASARPTVGAEQHRAPSMGRRNIVDLQIALGEFSPQVSKRLRYQALMRLDSIEDGAARIYTLEIVDDLPNRWSGSAEIKSG